MREDDDQEYDEREDGMAYAYTEDMEPVGKIPPKCLSLMMKVFKDARRNKMVIIFGDDPTIVEIWVGGLSRDEREHTVDYYEKGFFFDDPKIPVLKATNSIGKALMEEYNKIYSECSIYQGV